MTFRGVEIGDHEVVEITDERLVLDGGGDFHDGDGVPDEETTARAESIATRCGMVIVSMHGEWWGYSEYTPDPGDVSLFKWKPR